MELKEIRAVIDLMTKNQLSAFELEKDNFKIKIKKEGEKPLSVMQIPTQGVTSPQISSPTAASTGSPAPDEQAPAEGPSINSPMVGTFYRAPSPESPPFVEVGARVTPDSVVCIIEAMKVMNEIKAETTGVVAEVLIENGKPVEFGQPLFRIKSS